MSIFKILGKNGTNFSYYADGDTATVPGFLASTNTQQLTITSGLNAIILGSDVQIATGKGITSVGGAGNFDFSGSSGLFKTSTGAVTLGPGAISISGNATIQTGITLSTTGTGMINLPSLFQINSVAVSANVTATNLNTLTGGGNADALHTHTNVQASSLDLAGLTLWATPVIGEIGYISGDNTLSKAKADVIGTAPAVGVYAGVANTVLIGGKISILLEAGLSFASERRIWLSDTTAGRATNVEPTTTGHVSFELGRILDTTGYNSGTGSAQPCVWQPKVPVIL